MSSSQIPDAELAVLKLLWTTSGLTAREITRSVYRSTTQSSIGTVQKLLQRLEAKKFVERDRSQSIHRFRAATSRAEVASSQLDLLADRIADGSLSQFLTHLVKAKRLSQKEKSEIQRLLDEGG